MKQHLKNIWLLGVKELWSLWRDPMILFLICYSFTASIYTSAKAMPDTVNNAAIAIVDEDRSALSERIAAAFYPPDFITPQQITRAEMDPSMDRGDYTFVLNIPPNFQRDVLAGKAPEIQLNVDATRMSQAFVGANHVSLVVNGEVNTFAQRHRANMQLPVELQIRARYNQVLSSSWFGGVVEIINQVTMLTIILTGSALIREREHGTIEHLLVMPVTPAEIMIAKCWSMGAVVLVGTALSLRLVVQGALQVPINGSVPLFLCGASLCIFAMTALGIYMATLARTMPQFGLLLMLTIMPMQILSGGRTPRESMPQAVQWLMQLAPTTHFVSLGQSILFRGAGLSVVWPSFLALLIIGGVLFGLSLHRFRRTLSAMA